MAFCCIVFYADVGKGEDINCMSNNASLDLFALLLLNEVGRPSPVS